MIRRWDYRHGTEKATKLVTTHRHGSNILVLRKTENAGPHGWCQLHEDADVPATTRGDWTDPETGILYRNVRLCAECAAHCEQMSDVS